MVFGKIKEIIVYFVSVGLSIVILFFFIGSTWIGFEAKTLCRDARRDYKEQTCVRSLEMQLKDEGRGFRSRNDAVWALGQIGDSEALPTLEEFYTGEIPDREPLDEMISQHELEKAIKLLKGGTNITAFIWRDSIK